MSEQSFLGTWIVTATAGTPFGRDTRITLDLDQGPAVTFDPPVSKEALGVTYEAGLDMLRIEGIAGLASDLYLAVYLDPDYDYAALYGIATVQGSVPVTFAAVADQTPPSTTRSGSPAGTTPGGFNVRASSGSQFGHGSTFTYEDGAAPGEVTFSIVDALGREVPTPPTLTWVSPSTLRGVYQGDAPEDRLAMQCSFLDLAGRRRAFGLAAVGDPENSGVWAADEEEPPSPEI